MAVLVIRLEVDAPKHAVMGVKEHLAMELERFGDVRVASVDVVRDPSRDRQMSMWAAQQGYKEAAMRRR